MNDQSDERTFVWSAAADTPAWEDEGPDALGDVVQPGERLLRLLLGSQVFLYVFCGIGLQGVPGVARSALACVICLWCLLLEGMRRRRVFLEAWMWPPAIFLLYCLLMALRAPDTTFELMGKLFTAWGGALGVGVALRNGVRWTIPVHAMLCAVLASMAAYWLGIDSGVLWAQDDFQVSSPDRASGLMGNPNVFAMACGFPVYFTFLLRDHFPASLRIICLGLAVYGMVLTGSRKGVLLIACLLLCVGFYLVLTRGRVLHVALLALAALIGVVAFSSQVSDALFAGSDSVLALRRMEMAFHGQGGSFLNRMEFIRVSEDLFWQRPFLGYGLGMFRHVSGLGAYSHNNYCELAIGGGLLAVALFYTLHGYIFRRARRLPRTERACVWILLANVLVQDVAVVSYVDRTIILVLIMLMALAYRPSDIVEGRPSPSAIGDGDPMGAVPESYCGASASGGANRPFPEYTV